MMPCFANYWDYSVFSYGKLLLATGGRCSSQHGQVLLSVVLFGMLLLSTVLSMQLLRLQRSSLAFDLFVNQIENQRNLIRAESIRLQRAPTATELKAAQTFSAVIWPFDIVARSQDNLRWRLYLPRAEWRHRLQERVGGEINGNYWLSVEPVPSKLND